MFDLHKRMIKLPRMYGKIRKRDLNTSHYVVSVNGKSVVVTRRDHKAPNFKQKKIPKTKPPIDNKGTYGPIRCSSNVTQAEYYTPATSDVYAFDYALLQAPAAGLCSNTTQLLVFVLSHHNNKVRRMATRNTWANISNSQRPAFMQKHATIQEFKIVFVFGVHALAQKNRDLVQENQQYGDVLQMDFEESYANLTLKALAGLNWTHQHCPSVKYVMKIDDDIFVNVPILLQWLNEGQNTRMMAGYCISHSRARRSRYIDPDDHWFVSCDDFPFAIYPPYAAGHGYVISSDLIGELLWMANRIRPIRTEDAYITGILRKATGDVRLRCGSGFSAAGGDRRSRWDFPVTGKTYAVWNTRDMYMLWRYYLNYDEKVLQIQ